MRDTAKIALMIATSILATSLLSAAVVAEGDGFRLEGRDYRAHRV